MGFSCLALELNDTGNIIAQKYRPPTRSFCPAVMIAFSPSHLHACPIYRLTSGKRRCNSGKMKEEEVEKEYQAEEEEKKEEEEEE